MKVLVAMSGGVDSSVAAALLVDAGHHVVGVTMRLWAGASDTGCCSIADVDDARRVADQLGIDHVVFNFTEAFDEHVVDPYVEAHRLGLTPNPCIECNRHLKFDRLFERAGLLDFDAVATGHHAQVVPFGDGLAVGRGADPAKDQSYVVHMLGQDQLRRTMFPVGSMDKEAVRAIAVRRGLRTATKPDSQDVCFISHSDGRRQFLGERIPFRRADVVDRGGTVLGSVDAVELVTLGQRRGLGLPGGGPKRYVTSVDVAGGRVTVGDDADLDVSATVVGSLCWPHGPLDAVEVLVQCSAHGEPQPAVVGRPVSEIEDGRVEDDRVVVRWHDRHRRVAPGQSVVFYDAADRLVLGGGIAG